LLRKVVVSFGQSNVTSLVERSSRFTVLLKNPNKHTKPVMGKIMKAVRDLPHPARNPSPLIAAQSSDVSLSVQRKDDG